MGMPFDVGSSKNGAFKYLKDYLWSKVQGWIEKTMATAGKEVLVKAVAQAVPVFSMSCFKLPRGLCEHLNMLIRKFCWGSRDGKRKPAWVSWDVMTNPKNLGGLSFKDIEVFNLALLSRQAWRCLTEPRSLSSRSLTAAYYPTSSIFEVELGSNPSRIWRSIIDGRDVLKLGAIMQIGDGRLTNIWQPNWIPCSGMMRPITSRIPMPPTTVSELITVATAT